MATITVNYDTTTDTYYLTDDSGATIPGQSLINTAKAAGDRANTLGDVVYTDQASNGLVNESSSSAAATAQATDTPPPDNTGNANNANPSSGQSDTTTQLDPSDPNAWDSEDSATFKRGSTGSEPTFLGPYANPLTQYPDYTYGITLWMLTPVDFNALSDDPNNWTPSSGSGVIAASGGKFSTSGQYKRLMPYFDVDFYIEDLKMTTVVPTTTKGKGSTNDITASMTILEPTGITFVDRITLAAFDASGGGTHTQIPYMLEVDFYGADSTYIIQSQSLAKGAFKKRFPVIISKLGIHFGSKGTEYKIEFLPYPHTAFQDEKLQIDGKVENVKTVRDFFGGTSSESLQYLNDLRADPGDNQNILATSATISALNAQEQKENQAPMDSISASQAKANDEKNATDGLAYLINSFNFDLAFTETDTPSRTYPDFVKFVIHPDIADSTIIDPGSNSLKTIPMIAGDTSTLQNNKTVLDQKGGSFSVSKGSSILELINQVMRNSSYIQDQIVAPDDTDDAKSAAADKPFNWFKVIPKVQLTQWDEKVGRYAKKTTYYIMPYTVYHTGHPLSAQTVPTGKPYKLYNYYYTGKNTEIIDCKIEFQATYYQNVMLGNTNKNLDPGAKTGNDDATNPPPAKYPSLNGVTVGGLYLPVPTPTPRQVRHIVNDQQVASTMDANRNIKTQVAASVHSSLNASATANMLSVKMKILGDPQYIKQDELLWNPGSVGWVDPNADPDAFILTTGSLPYDGGEMYADLFFQTPVDIDTSTGLTTPPLTSSNPYIPTSFSGRFRIMKVENMFSHGKFEQDVEMVRYADQEVQQSKAVTSVVNRVVDAVAPTTPKATPSASAKATVSSDTPASASGAPDSGGSILDTIGGP